MIWDALLWLVIAKFAVMVFDDAMAAVRGKQSPRLAQRAAGRKAAGGSDAGRRIGSAFGDYLAGAAEDAVAAARSSRRQRKARRRGEQAIDGVLVTLDEDDNLFYADCDLCGWTSRGYQVQVNAHAAGAEHTNAQHPADDQDDQQEQPAAAPQPASGQRGPRLTVISGGAATTAGPAAPGQPTAANDGQDDDAVAAASHTTTDPAGVDGQPVTDPTGGRPAAGTTTAKKENLMNLEATGPEEIRAAFATAIETTNERAEELSGVAAVLGEAADRFESLEMAASTIGHLRDAADQMNTAHSALQTSVEELEAALADFNARDGHVAETVADAGNLASAEVLVG
ncbi:hypothetical protein GCM10010201_34650 [Pilimelia columellifera subsp. columellifera]|uniref:Uncharacterized protein n=2 Tax=Pilimelia TaxID=53370 RepID=A0ABP6B1D2_9ACTN